MVMWALDLSRGRVWGAGKRHAQLIALVRLWFGWTTAPSVSTRYPWRSLYCLYGQSGSHKMMAPVLGCSSHETIWLQRSLILAIQVSSGLQEWLTPLWCLFSYLEQGVAKSNSLLLQLFLTYKNKCFYLNINCKAVKVTSNSLNLTLSM